MREDLERLLRDTTLTTLALAIAVGWSLFQVCHGTATLVDGLTTHVNNAGTDGFAINGYGMTWAVGHRLLSLDSLVVGLVELAVALAVAVFVRRRIATAPAS
jgi:hypothetical protein